MSSLLCVKGTTIGEGKPLVCVPIVEKTKEGIVHEAEKLVQLDAQMLEWRVDAFAQADSLNAIREVLEALAPVVSRTPFIVTFRSKRQGGLMELDEDKIYDIHQVAAESHVADFVDVEYFEAHKPEKEIALLHSMGVHVIASHHDFDQTPERNVMWMLLEQMGASGADGVKLAVMPQSFQDVLNLLEETSHFHMQYPNRPIITMSMGEIGGISRVSGEFTGSCVTFGSGSEASAPGQLPMKELQEVLSILHRSIQK
ncbi:MAG: type I 3-dehydroquinate dehydratase [Oscillospiraceae bacterium]|nr:type I 3-dehydroquinate dehydratase [Oscillospiraceae bacterium]